MFISTNIKLGICISNDVNIDLDLVKSYSKELGLDLLFVPRIDLTVRYNIIYIKYNKNALIVVVITDGRTSIITPKEYEVYTTDDICKLIKSIKEMCFNNDKEEC